MLTCHIIYNYIQKDPEEAYKNNSLNLLYGFFDWLLSQQLGKGGRRRHGTKYSASLETYWKVYRHLFEMATEIKIGSKMNRTMHKVILCISLQFSLKGQATADKYFGYLDN
jgi:hypothetical protein